MTRFAILLAAGVSALTLVSAAQAADLIISQPAPVGVVNVGGNWDGPFIGVFAGGGWGTLTDDFTDDTSGWLLGVDVGANFTAAEGIVLGVVGDIAWANIENGEDDDFGLDWTGSLRGRLGFDGGAFMPYLTAGLAFGGGSSEEFNASATHFGWTAGVGMEFAVSDNASIDLLYRFTDLAPEDYNGPEVGFETHTVTAGLHWKF